MQGWLELLGAVGGVILIDVALSGDNALIIGAAAAGLPSRQRWQAIVIGGAGAIVLRILFAIAATLLLRLPLVQAVGGVVLLFIAVRLLLDHQGKHKEPQQQNDGETASARVVKRGFVGALLTILVADVTMSLDNILAIGALAHGDLPVLVIGLLASIALVLAGSAVVATLIKRLPWLLDVAALALGWTAAGMILHDLRLGPVITATLPYAEIALYALGVGIVLVADIMLRAHSGRLANLTRSRS